jgi:hypothetical protein
MDMRNTSERMADAVLIAGIVTAMLMAVFWWLQPVETGEDDFSVTIDCRAVIMNSDEFPAEIVQVCRDKVRFIQGDRSPMSTV